MQTKIGSYIGYAIKSGNIVFGVENIVSCRKVKVILADKTLSENSYDKVRFFANKMNIKIFRIVVEDYYKGRNCKAMGITESNLSAAIIKEMEESEKNG